MTYVDQMGQNIELEFPARRIVSLVPSQTEFLHALGLENEVVGITKFCVHPSEWWRGKKRVGGTKNANIERVIELVPDLIIGNKEENDQKNISDLSSIAPVWMSDIKSLDDAFDMMLTVGQLTNRETQAKGIVEEIKQAFKSLTKIIPAKKGLYFIWKDPWMLAGKDTFISHMMSLCGFQNLAIEDRYPLLEESDTKDVDLILLSSEPFPFKEKDKIELQKRYPNAQILFVDGEMFSWYGSRLLKAPGYFSELITSIE